MLQHLGSRSVTTAEEEEEDRAGKGRTAAHANAARQDTCPTGLHRDRPRADGLLRAHGHNTLTKRLPALPVTDHVGLARKGSPVTFQEINVIK